jgi:hypothetical protein
LETVDQLTALSRAALQGLREAIEEDRCAMHDRVAATFQPPVSEASLAERKACEAGLARLKIQLARVNEALQVLRIRPSRRKP